MTSLTSPNMQTANYSVLNNWCYHLLPNCTKNKDREVAHYTQNRKVSQPQKMERHPTVNTIDSCYGNDTKYRLLIGRKC
ncbi:hypothetical protein NQ315_008339 [Exocentrus adspersus]|uniref:Uncharacterized protein n=1 Tax=Exocentrus adspersus TaxID=1586481 RepID=A0AAV8VAE2_9CUCU|nr:hypothetical protein NQ315_008339 [Exocentrus adspersus]